ncbi:MAG: sigma 54-interacting transcriptional regulator, partial [Planctomycetota bacterium]
MLAAIDHPNLARLLDHGVLAETGETFVARTWIEGLDLEQHSRGLLGARDSEAIGRLVTGICPALEHLHRRGFVHADLKPANVIITPDGRPVLTDFGLSRRSGTARSEGGVAGTLYFLAPEQLLGGAVDARTDLFALGAMLHRLLLPVRASAREFYARFPGEDFFESSGTKVESLPVWARDVVARLLERDPSRRIQSAAEVFRILAGRLAMAGSGLDVEPKLTLPLVLGRERFCDEQRIALGSRSEDRWWVLPAGEDPSRVLEALRLRLAIAGCPGRILDVASEAGGIRDAADLDRWALDLAQGGVRTLLFAAVSDREPWPLRALECAARAFAQTRASGDPHKSPQLVVVATTDPPESDVRWSRAVVPAVGAGEFRDWLAGELEDQDRERVGSFAEILSGAGAGAATRLDALLRGASSAGWILAGRTRPRLRPGPLPTPSEIEPDSARPERPDAPGIGESARRLLASALVLGAGSDLRRVRELAEIEEGDLGTALEPLVAAGLAELSRTEDGMRVRAFAQKGPAARVLVPEATWRALHARAADLASKSGGRAQDEIAHRWRADPGPAAHEAVAREMESLRERGLAELAVQLGGRVSRLARDAGLPSPLRVEGETALAWAALGEPERALEFLVTLEVPGADASARAVAERVRGQVASLRNDLSGALAHFARSATIDPAGRGEALLCRARIQFEARADGELETLEREIDAGAHGALPERVQGNLAILFAMSAFRLGRVEEARDRLARALEGARAVGDGAREGAVRVNLATLARRTGDHDGAVRHLEAAIELQKREGLLPALAQAQAMLGGTLREAGELERAGQLLSASLSVRERLGDLPGSAAVRAMLGLVHADRGHVLPAIEDLTRSAEALRSTERAPDRPLLLARAEEACARLQRPADPSRTAEPSADPRVEIARARARWIRGHGKEALALARSALEHASALRLAAAREEARWLVRRIQDQRSGETGSGSGILPSEAAPPLVLEDGAVLAALGSDLREPKARASALALAAGLERRGRDDRAARLYLAIASRDPDAEVRAQAEARAREALARCAIGLDALEREALRSKLLSMPDPAPADLSERSRGPDDAEDKEMEIVKLLEINHRLVQQEDPKQLLGVIVESALSVTGAERGFLVLEEDGEFVFDTALDSVRGDIGRPELEISRSIVREALAQKVPLRLSNAADDPLLGGSPSVNALDLRSILCVPFAIQPGLNGVVYVDHRLREGAFDPRAERLLGLLADQAALAIRQVRRVEEIRRLNRELKREVAAQQSDLRTARVALVEAGLPDAPSGIVGHSTAIRRVHALLERAAPSAMPVLVTGASGTGKELAARALHALSARASRPFVTENCAALPPALIEAELFGHRKGAYTGAEEDRAGMFERAAGGTLFLDEIGELPLEL